jgi:deoxyribose-phosphate aldolase
MKAAVGEGVQVKASTGVKTREDADRLIAAGATRLGTSSGPAIVEGAAGVGTY